MPILKKRTVSLADADPDPFGFEFLTRIRLDAIPDPTIHFYQIFFTYRNYKLKVGSGPKAVMTPVLRSRNFYFRLRLPFFESYSGSASRSSHIGTDT